MNNQNSMLIKAQIGAMVISLVVFILIAVWYLIPLLKRLSKPKAIIVLLWVHIPRYITLIMYSAQRECYPISAIAAKEAVVGDVVGAIVALAAIAAFRKRERLGILFSWLLVIETIVDVVVGFVRKAHEPLWGKASGVTWLILDFYIPLILICLPLLIWQLISRSDSATFSGL